MKDFFKMAIVACVLVGSMASLVKVTADEEVRQEREFWALIGIQIPEPADLLRYTEEKVNETTDNIAAELEWMVKEEQQNETG